LATSAAIAVTAAAPPGSSSSVTAPATATTGAAFQATVTNGNNTASDWAGLFAVGGGNADALQWQYLNGTQAQPGAGIANATLQFTAPTTAGNYEIRLYAKGYVRLATSGTIAVSSTSGSGSASLTATPSSVRAGNAIQVSVSNSPGNSTDWVGLFAVGGADSQSLEWKYLNGQQSQPAAGLTSATLNFTAPATPGNYEVRLYAKGYVRLGTTNTIAVNP
jgi:hypothetical protein